MVFNFKTRVLYVLTLIAVIEFLLRIVLRHNSNGVVNLHNYNLDDVESIENERRVGGSSTMPNMSPKSVTQKEFREDNIYAPTNKFITKKRRTYAKTDPYEDLCTIPEHVELVKLPFRRLGYLYHSYLSCVQILCTRNSRMGKIRDGGWDICVDEDFVPRTPCLVYSFGINNEFSFDDAVASHYACEVYAFDPSMKKNPYRRTSRNWFYNIGVHEMNGPLPNTSLMMSTFQNILENLNHTNRVLSIVKLDTEGSEWKAFPEMFKNTNMTKIQQLVVEFHNPYDESEETYIRRLDTLRGLYRVGFRIFMTHRNHYCQFYSKALGEMATGCHEVGLLNIRYASKNNCTE